MEENAIDHTDTLDLRKIDCPQFTNFEEEDYKPRYQFMNHRKSHFLNLRGEG